MPHVAMLSMDNLEDFFVYDELLTAPFNAKGWDVSAPSWHDQSVDYNQFDAVIVRSTWDYQQMPQAFVECLTRIENSTAKLENDYQLMLWNIEKTYLKDLQQQGVPVVDTTWTTGFDVAEVMAQFDAFKCDELIVKPVLSANADDTYRLTREGVAEQSGLLIERFTDRAMMIQPFLPVIVEEGEYSLFYFDSDYSHAILKTPQQGDFRVQEEHGGQLLSITPDNSMLEAAQKALAAMPQSALYARVDLVRTNTGWAVMELELIEPSLYFNLDEASPQRFVDAFLRRYQG